jgi:hypothetical protein
MVCGRWRAVPNRIMFNRISTSRGYYKPNCFRPFFEIVRKVNEEDEFAARLEAAPFQTQTAPYVAA